MQASNVCFFHSFHQAYLIACVWNCYRYVTGRGSSEILLYVTTNDTTVSHLWRSKLYQKVHLSNTVKYNCTYTFSALLGV